MKFELAVSCIIWAVLQASYYSNPVYTLNLPNNSTQKFSIGNCWMQSWRQPVCLQHHWISELVIEGPILLTLLLNFYIFLNVLRVISSMNRQHQSQTKVKLMKSTMTLIPLLGLLYLGARSDKGGMHDVSFEVFYSSFL